MSLPVGLKSHPGHSEERSTIEGAEESSHLHIDWQDDFQSQIYALNLLMPDVHNSHFGQQSEILMALFLESRETGRDPFVNS